MRRNEAKFIESRKRWQINVQKYGVRKTFISNLKGRKGKIEAERKADKWLERFEETIRLDVAWELYMQDMRGKLASTTYQNAESVWKCAFVPNIDVRRKLESITLYDWQQMIDAYAVDHKEATCKGVIARITSFLDYARRRRWAHERVEPGDLTVPDTAGKAKERKPIEAELFEKLMAADYEDFGWFVHAVQFAVLTGLRRGEAAGLTWAHVNTKERYIDVVDVINRHDVVTAGKTSNARRRVPLQTMALDVLARQREHLKRAGIVSEYVFPRADGSAPHAPMISDQYRKWVRKQGAETTMHELRHTFVSVCYGNLQLDKLKKSVGHSGSMDTGAVYAHEIRGAARETAREVDTAFRKYLEGEQDSEDCGAEIG